VSSQRDCKTDSSAGVCAPVILGANIAPDIMAPIVNTERSAEHVDCRMTEADAIERAKTGDVTGYNTLYQLHKRAVYTWCLRSTGNVSDAEDLTQEVFLQVYRKISTFRGDSKFGSWLYRVAFNLSRMQFRKRPHDVSLGCFGDVRPDPIASQITSRGRVCSIGLERVALAQAIRDLSKAKRNVVLLHDVKGLTHREVAAQLGLTISTSKSQLCRAHVLLRDVLGRTRYKAPKKRVTLGDG
jgi:RNA polymerase sigma-70 factor (ECF subfamily)